MDEAIKAAFLAEIMKGRSVRDICRDEGMPTRTAIYAEMAADTEFANQYARACEVRADDVFDQLFDIADDKDEDPNRSRLRIDARKWALARMNPRKYGEKMDVTSDGKRIEGVAMTFVEPKPADS